MRSAKVDNGFVTNVIVGSLEGYVECAEDVQIGWSHDGSGFIRPHVETVHILPHLEPDQFWFVVRVSGHEDELITWLDTLREDDPIAWAAASSKLQFAKYFERDHPFVEAAREALSIPSEQLDALWSYGATS